jgi:hypothetical protein
MEWHMERGDLTDEELKRAATEGFVVACSEWEEPCLRGKVRMEAVAIGDSGGRTLRFEFKIPNAELLVFPDDLGVLVQLFGWTVTDLESEMRCRKRSFLWRRWHAMHAWLSCSFLLGKVRRCLNPDDVY